MDTLGCPASLRWRTHSVQNSCTHVSPSKRGMSHRWICGKRTDAERLGKWTHWTTRRRRRSSLPTDRGSRVPKIIEGKIEVDFRIWRIVIILPRVQGWKMQVGSKALRFHNRGLRDMARCCAGSSRVEPQVDQSKGDFEKNSSWNKQREPQRAWIDICIWEALFFQDRLVLSSPRWWTSFFAIFLRWRPAFHLCLILKLFWGYVWICSDCSCYLVFSCVVMHQNIEFCSAYVPARFVWHIVRHGVSKRSMCSNIFKVLRNPFSQLLWRDEHETDLNRMEILTKCGKPGPQPCLFLSSQGQALHRRAQKNYEILIKTVSFSLLFW